MTTKLSKDNNRVKFVRSVTQYKKTRNEHDVLTVEGETLFRETPSSLIEEVFVREDEQELIALAESVSDRVYLLDSACFKSISDVSSPSGILALVKKPQSNRSLGNRILLLDGIQDPGNAGTLLRGAAGFHFDSVIFLDSVEAYSPKVVRSSMSAIFKVNIVVATRSELKQLIQGYPLLIMDMDGKDVSKFSFPDKFVIAVGNEANGISDDLTAIADETLSIFADGIESLNAGVAGNIAMYAASINH